MTDPTPDGPSDRGGPPPAAVAPRSLDALFRMAIDAIDARVSIFDADDRLVFLNAAAMLGLQTLEIDRSRLIGRTRVELNRLLLEHGLIDQRQFERLGGRDPKVDMEITGRLWMSVRRFPLPDGGLVVVASDVTEIRRAEQVLAAEQRLSTIGSLVSGVAHEFNTPLGVAVTAASFLRDAVARAQGALRAGALTVEETERTLGAFADAAALILSNLDRSADLVRGFKALAAEPVADDRHRVRIRRHLSGVVATLISEARSRGHTVVVDCPADVEVVTAPEALSRVLTNLVLNALRHAFENRSGGIVLVTVTRQDGHLRIVVGDNGIGMDPDALPRIFEPFFTTRRHHGDRGLGLAVVHNLVTRSLGGTIETEGKPGEGLRQIVTIPLEGPTDRGEPVRGAS